MLMPSIFGEDLFDDFMGYPTGRQAAANAYPQVKDMMKTDIREHDNGYEIDIDLPGFPLFGLFSAALLAATLVGIHAAAVITVNNYRDHDGDKANGKNTLAVRLGRTATKWVYTVEVLAPYVLLPLLADLGWPAALPLLSLPLAGKLIHRFHNETPGPGFNQILAATAGLQLTFALLLSLSFTI